MIPHKLNKKLLILAVIGIVLYFSSNIALSLSGNASMEENLGPPAVSKEAAQEAAVSFARDRLGFTAAGADALYATDKYASGYIVKNDLNEAYKKSFADKALLDYWLVIATDSRDNTLKIRVGMDKPDVLGWESDETLKKTHDEKGLTAAMKGLADAGYDPNGWTYAPHEADNAANLFTFVSRTEALGEAPLSVTVGVKDGEAVSVVPGFKIPASYMDWIKSQERMASWMTVGFLLSMAAMGITALVLAIVYGRKVSWSRGIILAAVFMVLYLIQNLNVSDAMLTVQGLGKETAAKVITYGLVAVLSLLFTAAVWFSLLSGEQQWRKLGFYSWSRWRDSSFGKDVFYGMGRGYLICFFILGIQQVAFLIAGTTFHSFSINDPAQSTLNMRWPLLFPATAWVAAIMEEAIYRLFGIALFKRILRYNFPAILASGLLWGLGHAGYTIYPSYTRLFEVTVLAFIFGYAFLRYGFITAVFAHAVMDSLLMAIYLMTDDPTPARIAWGIFYIVLPAVIGYVIRFLHPKFARPRQAEPPGLPPEPRLVP